MAKMNGIQLKNVTYYTGHEGERCLQANIYIDIDGKAKKIGSVSEETWSGEYDIAFDKEEYEDLLNARREQYYKKYPAEFQDNTAFMYELGILTDKEKTFNKFSKKVEKWNKEAGKDKYTPYLLCILFENSQNLKSVWECPTEEGYKRVIIEQKAATNYLVYSNLNDFII